MSDGTRRTGRVFVRLLVLLVCVGTLVPLCLTLIHSIHRGRRVTAIIVDEGRVLVESTAHSARQTVRDFVIDRHDHDGARESSDDHTGRTGLQIVMTLSTVMLLLYVVYVVVDGAMRGCFRGLAFTLATLALVGSCAVLLKLA